MTSDRIKEIQQTTAYPDSRSVKQALLQVWNECEQENNPINSDIKPDFEKHIKELLALQITKGEWLLDCRDDACNKYTNGIPVIVGNKLIAIVSHEWVDHSNVDEYTDNAEAIRSVPFLLSTVKRLQEEKAELENLLTDAHKDYSVLQEENEQLIDGLKHIITRSPRHDQYMFIKAFLEKYALKSSELNK